MDRNTDFTNQPFINYSAKSSSQRNWLPQCNSQSDKVNAGNEDSRSLVIKVSISVCEDLKLHETENPWKPARFINYDNISDDELKTYWLYRKVRCILNKLTPQNFDKLIGQVRELEIDTTERLQGVIDLVVEKAIDKPIFSFLYALMCRELAMMHVYDKERETNVNFRKLLITRCQMEFEKQSFDESVRLKKIKEINECTDSANKRELQLELEEYDRRVRMKSVGNIRFIGELFKQSMLTVNIMIRCLQNLLEHKDEESLECLCTLLKTIGKTLEIQKKFDLSQIFGVMKDLADKKYGKISGRIRFMLQDVINLRNNKWVSHLKDLNPKTIDQIIKEAETEQFYLQTVNKSQITPNHTDDSTTTTTINSGLYSERSSKSIVSDNSCTITFRSRKQPFSGQSDRFEIKAPVNFNELFGLKQLFDDWSQDLNIKNEPLIDANDCIQGVIDFIFEKTVDEPNFCVAYALMCGNLANMRVYDNKKNLLQVRKLLITRCQFEFEKLSFDKSVRLEKIKEIDECTDNKKKTKLQFELEEYDKRIRMKSLGYTRFIGELFNQSLLTVNIIMKILQNLLENKDEESLVYVHY